MTMRRHHVAVIGVGQSLLSDHLEVHTDNLDLDFGRFWIKLECVSL